MRVFITGYTGFVGTNLVKYLGKKSFSVQISGYSRNPDRYINNVESYNHLDLDFNGYDAIIHLAGKAHDVKNAAGANEYIAANFEFTKLIFSRFLLSNAKKFIFLSSVKAVADKVQGALTEDIYPNPITPYGKSKLMAENYILENGLPRDKAIYILRPCMIHGPGNKGNLNLLYNFINRGIPYPLGAFDNKRSFLSIENLCFIIGELLHRSIPSGIYNVSDDQPLSSNELVGNICKILGKKRNILNVNRKIVTLFAKMGDILRVPVNSEWLEKLTADYIVSNEKIKKVIGKELPYNTREGINITIQSFRK